MKFTSPECRTCPNRWDSIFKCCNEEDVKLLDFHKVGHLYHKGQILFHEGGTPQGLYCLRQGKVKIVKKSPDGKEQIIKLVKEGDPIGHKSLLLNTSYSASAVILEDSIICFIPKQVFEKMRKESDIESALLIKMTKALSEAENKVANLTLKQVRERMAEALLFLNKFYNQENISRWIVMSREDLGNLVGTAKETAIRVLSDFKSQKIIMTQGRKIKILDKEKLIRLSKPSV
ncbi:MAG: Crp/Fnr family transcriptional regulator [Cytophagaceae bacterium]